MNVLIVDDELDYRLLLGRLLSERGNCVFLAENGRDGLLKLKMAKMDLVISDVYMPIMDGFAFHRVVRSLPDYQTVPVLFVSAYEDDPAHRATRNPKLDAFHKKERSVEEFLAWIEYLTKPSDLKRKRHPAHTNNLHLAVSAA